MSTDGGPTGREVRRMSREELLALGNEMDTVRILNSELPIPPDDHRRQRRATAAVVGLLSLSVISAAAFVGIFAAWPHRYVPPGVPGHTRYLLYTPLQGITAGLSVLALAFAIGLYFKKFMPDELGVMDREDGPSDVVDRKTAAAFFHHAGEETDLANRRLTRRMMLAGATAFGAIAGVLGLGSFVLNPWTGKGNAALWVTAWKSLKGETVYLRVLGSKTLVRPEDVAPGGAVSVVPYRKSDQGDDKLLTAADHSTDAPALLVRFRPGTPVHKRAGQESYNYGDFYAYSRICTHLGCPATLWNELTNVTLCPCHQSAFDLSDGGQVVFGPAVRPLPQLPITVNDEGYFVATGDFSAPVGPEFWTIRAGEHLPGHNS